MDAPNGYILGNMLYVTLRANDRWPRWTLVFVHILYTQMSASIQRQSLTLQMVSHQKCNLAASSERQRNNYILKFSFHFHEIQFRTKSCTFLTHLNVRLQVLRTTRESFFFENPKLLGSGRQIWPKNFWAFGVFSADLSAPILVLWVSCPCFPLINHYFYKN